MTRPLPMELAPSLSSKKSSYSKIVARPSLMESSNTRKYINDDDEELFIYVFNFFISFNNYKNKIEKVKILLRFNNEIKDDKDMTSYYDNYKKIYEEFKNNIKKVEKSDYAKEEYKELFNKYLSDCLVIYKTLNDDADKIFKEKIYEHILYVNIIYYEYLVKDTNNDKDEFRNDREDKLTLFELFKFFPDFNSHNKRLNHITDLMDFNSRIKYYDDDMKSYYPEYEKIYNKLKESIKEEKENENENKKENYKKIFLNYINDCKQFFYRLNDTNDIKFKEKLSMHITYLQDIYKTYLNKETVVQGGKKSSEYIDYKFQNKIYRRKIRYEGKKKYIILNKQKVFIKNKK
jgi:hypothetical protein